MSGSIFRGWPVGRYPPALPSQTTRRNRVALHLPAHAPCAVDGLARDELTKFPQQDQQDSHTSGGEPNQPQVPSSYVAQHLCCTILFSGTCSWPPAMLGSRSSVSTIFVAVGCVPPMWSVLAMMLAKSSRCPVPCCSTSFALLESFSERGVACFFVCVLIPLAVSKTANYIIAKSQADSASLKKFLTRLDSCFGGP